MGGDGGSIPGRADIIRVKGYGFKRNLGGMGYDPNTLIYVGDGRLAADEIRSLAFTRCRMSQEPLRPPIVVDREGNIYNKEIVLSLLIDKKIPEELARVIRKMRDLKQIAPAKSAVKTPFPVFDEDASRLQCSLSGTQCTGAGTFFVNWRCGCLFSQRAAEEIAGMALKEMRQCPVCGGSDEGREGLDLVELVPAPSRREVDCRKRVGDGNRVAGSSKRIKADDASVSAAV